MSDRELYSKRYRVSFTETFNEDSVFIKLKPQHIELFKEDAIAIAQHFQLTGKDLKVKKISTKTNKSAPREDKEKN